ncbi:hypothetical protein T05_6389 [Trichinella murrelli]|uniref:Uncharacterized protein n=1 Tax=Trichinella murrelli TaxID=144512 RepID=A0A0V0TDF7_9BILA|nr:hypothetical protein T05_6389 [Trichinella murrelli]
MAVLIHWKADVLSQITRELSLRFLHIFDVLFVCNWHEIKRQEKNCDSVHYVIRSNSIGMKLASVGDLNFFKNVIQKSPPLLNLISKYFGRRN